MIKVFVGCAPNHEDAESQAVLEYSIRKEASEPVDIIWMKLSRDPASPFYSDGPNGWQTSAWATPFSGFRWGIPAFCDFQGRAIYMDSDIIVLADIAELWRQEIPADKIVLAKGGAASWRYCVSLWDCEKAGRAFPPLSKLKSDPGAHKAMCRFMASHPALIQQFDGNWNCLDGEKYDRLDHPEIKALHYTSMRHQPQLKYAIPRLAAEGRKHWYDGTPETHFRADVIELFDLTFAEAVAAGYTVESYCEDAPYGTLNKRSVAGSARGVPTWGKEVA